MMNEFIDTFTQPLRTTIKDARAYNRETFKRDLLAGLTVGIVAVPQAMAFAMIAGVNPIYGLYGVIVQSAIGCLFTSSSHLSIGPTNTTSLLVASVAGGIAGPGAAESVYLSTVIGLALITGLVQLAFAVGGMGTLFRYVSHSVIVGFTAGAGILIIGKQAPAFLGLPGGNGEHGEHWPGIIGIIQGIWPNVTDIDGHVLMIGLISLGVMVGVRHISKWLPAPLLAVLAGSIIVALLGWEANDPRVVGPLPSALPSFQWPDIGLSQTRAMLGGGLAIALLGMLEAVAIAKSIAMRTDERINANQEFVAQGVMNTVSSFFGCYPGTGSFSRSALNYTAGARTRFAGLVNSVFVAAALLLFGWLGQYLPTASLAAILFVVAYGLIDWRYFMRLWHANHSDTAVCVATLVATLVIPLEYAIFVGIFLNIALYLRRASQLHLAEMVRSPGGPYMERPIRTRNGEKRVMFLQVEGDLFFGLADELQDRLTTIANSGVQVIILRLKRTHSIDATVMDVLEKFVEQMHTHDGHVILCGLRPELYERLDAFGLVRHIGEQNVFQTRYGVFASAKAAIERARVLVGSSIDVASELTEDDSLEGWMYEI